MSAFAFSALTAPATASTLTTGPTVPVTVTATVETPAVHDEAGGNAEDGTGYVLASSQGDDAFAVYEREGDNGYLGSFAVTDGVQHSDGSTVVNVPLGRTFPEGLLITHDGEATPADGDREGTGFKFVRWDAGAGAFPEPLTVDTDSFDPRDAD